jgi:hypothetical protein
MQNLFGFSAVATGALYGYNGYSEVEGQNTMFWTATPIESYDYAWGMNIYHWEITVDVAFVENPGQPVICGV